MRSNVPQVEKKKSQIVNNYHAVHFDPHQYILHYLFIIIKLVKK